MQDFLGLFLLCMNGAMQSYVHVAGANKNFQLRKSSQLHDGINDGSSSFNSFIPLKAQEMGIIGGKPLLVLVPNRVGLMMDCLVISENMFYWLLYTVLLCNR